MKSLKRYVCLLLAAALLLTGLPVMAEDGVTRAFAVYSFVETMGEDAFAISDGDLSAFADAGEVPPQYREAMEIAVANGVILGSDGLLRPNQELTRLEAMIILGRFLDDLDEVRPSSEFGDVPLWAEEEIDRLYRAGIVNGYGDGRLGADDLVSPEQLALLTARVRAAYPWTADLKDDYYSYVNREFLKGTQLNDSHPSFAAIDSGGAEIQKYIMERSEALLASLRAGAEMTPIEEAAAQFYELALKASDGGNTLAPAQKYFDMIDGCADVLDLGRVNGAILRDLGVPILFDITVHCVLDDGYLSAVGGTDITLLSSGVDRTYWADDPEGVRAAYEAYAAEVFSMAGINVPDAVLDGLSAFQRDVTLAGLSRAECYGDLEDDRQYVFDWQELSSLYRGQWKNPIPYILFAIDPKEIAGGSGYVIYDRGAVDKTVELLNTGGMDVARALCKLNLIERLSDFLPSAYREAKDRFACGVMGFGSGTEPAARFAAGLTSTIFVQAYDKEYVERQRFDAEFLRTMTEDITDVFRRKFAESSHISPATAEKLKAKLDKIKKYICSYEEDTAEEGSFTVNPDESFLANGINIFEAVNGDFTAVVDMVDIPFPSYTLNATYLPYKNEISIYAGILKKPFYDPDASYEENLGGIGAAIAHEISHAFDGDGSLYDGDGYYDPWWSEDEYEYYTEFEEKLDAYYERFSNMHGDPVDVAFTRNENIADILGMECVIALAKEKNLDLDKVFRSYASTWAATCTPAYGRYLIRYDEHSPGNVRVNAVLSCFDEFYETYGIVPGDGMYVPPEERVRFF